MFPAPRALGVAMGMLLSVPLMLAGFAFIAAAMKRPPLRRPA